MFIITHCELEYHFLQPCLRCHTIFFPRSRQKNRRDRFWHSSLSPYYVSPSSIYYLLIKFHSRWWCPSLQLLYATGPLHILPEIVPLFSYSWLLLFHLSDFRRQYNFTAVLLFSVYRCNNDERIFHTRLFRSLNTSHGWDYHDVSK